MDYTLLLKAPLFRGLSAEMTERIFSDIPYRIRKFRPSSMIAQSGESVSSLMIVLKGTVKGEMVDFAGKVIKIEDIPAPGALASAFIFGNNNRFPVNVITLSEVELLIIEKSDFIRLLMKNDTLLLNYLNMISNRSQFLSEKIRFLSFKTIKGKLAQYILELSEKSGKDFRIDKTQSELADYFGVARPSVARALGEMEEAGLISAGGKQFRILNKEGLTAMLLE